MKWSLYAAAMARVHYYRVPKQSPIASDPVALTAYWNHLAIKSMIH